MKIPWISFKLQLLPRQFKRLEAERKQTGSPIAELIRRAVDITYPEEGKK
jgi:hypothetical protein